MTTITRVGEWCARTAFGTHSALATLFRCAASTSSLAHAGAPRRADGLARAVRTQPLVVAHTFVEHDGAKDVRGSESNCEQDSRKM